ncbi:hypothetical protein OOT55_15205 [Marinimicrobium sp. C6131]|uniref:hypothetical protein n=1 Tax=Marinimicrobium sp. C6131 TaxID=3022676 RepID=UPI00223D7EED|nr:hypothetical protein [Marinimicrobium sp. C6131]UZJ43989.1 hypothetical protein OOT55_15205 [Marinimicrobium sp. C6131]
MSWILGTLATATGFAGVLSLYRSWRLPLPKPTHWRRLGWILLVLSLIAWLWAQPAEFAVCFALTVPALLAWLWIGWASPDRQPARDTKLEQRTLNWPRLRVLGEQLLKLVISVPLAGLASALFSFAVTDLLPWEAVNRLVTGVLMMPVFWGLASYWVLADTRLWRPTLVLITTGALSAGYLFLL